MSGGSLESSMGLLSGNDSEESFINRLNEDLQKLKQEFDDKLSKEGFTE